MVDYILALIVTIILECVVYFFSRGFWSNKKGLLVIIGANLITNPIFNFILFIAPLIYRSNPWFIIILEVCVILVEAYIFKVYLKYTTSQAIKFSIIANLISWIMGGIILNILWLIYALANVPETISESQVESFSPFE
jgi:hypothetical protein